MIIIIILIERRRMFENRLKKREREKNDNKTKGLRGNVSVQNVVRNN